MCEETRVCKVCSNIVELKPIYADVNDGENGPCVEIIDCLSLCECGNDVLEYVCHICDGEGCPICLPE
jgi:hypothetical protein